MISLSLSYQSYSQDHESAHNIASDMLNDRTALDIQATKRELIIGVSRLNRYPMIVVNEGHADGLGWAILEAFAEASDIQFHYVSMPMTRLQPAMDKGDIDFIFPDNPKWVNLRSSEIPNIYSAPIMNSISATFVNGHNAEMTIDQVKKISIPFGYTAYTWIEPISKYGIKSVPSESLENGLHSLKVLSADAVDIEYNIARHIINSDSYWKGISVAKNLPNAKVNYHLSSIKHILILEKISGFIEANPGLIKELKNQYDVKSHAEIFPVQ